MCLYNSTSPKYKCDYWEQIHTAITDSTIEISHYDYMYLVNTKDRCLSLKAYGHNYEE